MNRRDLLKFFGAGTIIAPVAAQGIAAKLIEVPKIELVEPAPIEIAETMPDINNQQALRALFVEREVCKITIENSRLQYRFSAFVSKLSFNSECRPIDITRIGSPFREFIPGAGAYTITAEVELNITQSGYALTKITQV